MIYIYNKYLINKREREREREREKISQIQPNSAKFSQILYIEVS